MSTISFLFLFTILFCVILISSGVADGKCTTRIPLAFIASAPRRCVASAARLVMLGANNNNDNPPPPPDDMPKLPNDVVKYSQVPAAGKDPFKFEKIPKGLLNQHSTKKGTWGLICVQQGKLQYQINEPKPIRSFELTPTTYKGVIEPTILHQVKPLTEDVEFIVEFYRLPNTGPVDEKRE